MTLVKYALAYTRCSDLELRAFILARSGQQADRHPLCQDTTNNRTGKPSARHRRRAMIEILESLDTNATFRFMDLAPELRVEVYRQVLVHNKPKSKCTSILTASKLVHREAKDVLYSERIVKISAHFHQVDDQWAHTNSFSLRRGNINWYAHNVFGLDRCLSGLTRPLRNIKHLDINITFSGALYQPDGFPKPERWAKVWMFLQTVITASDNPRWIRVDVGTRHSRFNRTLTTHEPLLPLADLDAECTLELTGVSEEVEKAFWEAATAADIGHGLGDWSAESDAHLAWARKMAKGILSSRIAYATVS